jgi:predicted AAA+ superfamily ATPase
MIKRIAENKVLSLIRKFPAVGIIGPRQSGKTTLAKIIAKKIKKHTVYLDLENPDDLLKLQNPAIFLEENSDKLVVLDEIQIMPELFPLLRSHIDKKRTAGRFLLLGSASPNLVKGSSESLAGRIAYIELSPFNLIEIFRNDVLYKHWFRGGFPLSYLAKNDNDSNLWLNNFIRTYIERDFRNMGLDINSSVSRKLLTMLSHYNGKILNMSDLSTALGLTVPTIKRYLDFLESAFLLRHLQPFYINIGKRLVKSPKIYLRDSGMLHRLSGINKFSSLMGNPLIGYSWEGYVIEQIFQLLNEDLSMYYYRTHKGTEADIVFVKSNIPIAIAEIKYSPNPQDVDGLKKSIADLKTKINFIITPNSDDYVSDVNIRVCNLSDFLFKHLPKII